MDRVGSGRLRRGRDADNGDRHAPQVLSCDTCEVEFWAHAHCELNGYATFLVGSDCGYDDFCGSGGDGVDGAARASLGAAALLASLGFLL